MGEEVSPKICHDVLADGRGEVGMPHHQQPLQEEQAPKFHDGGVQGGRVPLHQHGIHQAADDPQHAEIDAGDRHDQPRGDRHAQSIGAEVGGESAETRHENLRS